MKNRFALLLACLGGILVLAGPLALAAPSTTTAPTVPNDSQPWWAPNGRAIAFQRESPALESGDVLFTPAARGAEVDIIGAGRPRGFRPGEGQLLVELDGATSIRDASDRQLGAVAGTDAAWSPDGGHIAFLHGDVLEVADAAGANVLDVATSIVPPTADLTGPVWSPRGGQLTVAKTTESGSALVVAGADGSGAQVVFEGANQIANPSWSPDGSKIAFEWNSTGRWVIWSVRPDGTDAHPEIGGAADYRFPQWSPADGRLAFIAGTGQRYALYVRPATGGANQKLVDDVRPDSPPRWSPTGSQLAVAAGQDCRRWGIYVVSSQAPARPLRRSNQCRIDGTGGADVIYGTAYFDVIHGLGGNDAAGLATIRPTSVPATRFGTASTSTGRKLATWQAAATRGRTSGCSARRQRHVTRAATGAAASPAPHAISSSSPAT